MKLKIELYRYGTLVFGKVLEQSAEITCSKEIEVVKTICEIDGFSIKSCSNPSLGEDFLYIRGSVKEHDNEPFVLRCITELKAVELCDKIKKCVDKINNEGKTNNSIEKIL